jgi:hypothetical protein
VKVELCGAKNPDYPSEYACELFAGHGRVRPNDPNEHPDNWYAHAAPSEGAWWNLPEDPMTEDNSGLTVEPVTRPDDPLEPARLARIAQLSRALVSYGLTGRWSWAGTLTSGYHLRTKANGGRWVMGAQNVHEHYEVDADGDGGRVVPTDCTGAAGTDACSAGYRDQQAQDRPVPAFAVREPDSPWTTIRPASGIPIFSVCPDATSALDPRVYRDDVCGFRSPVAELAAALDAETVLALLEDRYEVRSVLGALVSALDRDPAKVADSMALTAARECLGRPAPGRPQSDA